MEESLRIALLVRLETSPATLAELRALLPPDHPYARALPSMGEADPFGDEVTTLVSCGLLDEEDGRYRLL